MKKILAILVLCQAAFTTLQVYFILKISFIGKVGIALAYKEYKFLRSGWQTFFIFFGIQLIAIGILLFAYYKLTRKRYYLAITFLLFTSVIGLVLTYNDFANTYTHRLLKERFHLGFYLFWFGLVATCIVFYTLPHYKRRETIIENRPAMSQQFPDQQL